MRTPQRGQAFTEYTLLVAALALALFLPVFDGKSIVVRLVEVWDIYIQSFHTVIGLPVP